MKQSAQQWPSEHRVLKRLPMSIVLPTLISVFVLSLGARDQLIVGQFSDAAGRTGPMLVLGIAVAAVSAAAAAYAGWSIAAFVPSDPASLLPVVALILAALDVAIPVRLKAMKEPTRSYVAIAVVLFVRQLMSGPRLAIFAIAALATDLWMPMLGGVLGGAIAIAGGWHMGKDGLEHLPLIWIRRVFAASLIVAAFLIGLNAYSAAL
ncbi:hypothetical protein [Erythrobacter rubeus]|uniref:GDT1 family protein n=1 Tax=Erythrobacter rubeus TaxID=2760803 RepID=A0ABR8KKS9_9SPHN|nr:hypothetical protein [Erythrobacter rubeus]MBD2840865.1 hypothetical protein [Erythrobacter rubeus]